MSLEEAVKPLLGVWKCDNSRTENFEEFLKEMGFNYFTRKLAKRSSPTMTISLSDGLYHIKTETGFMTKVSTLPLDGSETEEEYYGGGKAKAYAKAVDGIPIVDVTPTDPKHSHTTVSREIINNELVQKIDVGNGKVVCTRVFTKLS